jgi:hypothetical protein
MELAASDNKAAAASRMLKNDNHPRSNCPLWRRLTNPQDFSTGYIVRTDWTGTVTVIHNVNKDDAAKMGPGGTEAHINAALVRYANTISRMYHLTRQGNFLIVGDRR